MGLAGSAEKAPAPTGPAERAAEGGVALQTKDLQRRGCALAWLDGGVRLSWRGGAALTVLWRDVAAVNVQPMFSKPSLVVLDCVPEGADAPMLVKVWLADLKDVAALREELVRYDESPEGHGLLRTTGRNALWSGLYSPPMLPYYSRSLNAFYTTVRSVLQLLLVWVTAFMVLEAVGMHSAGLADPARFTQQAAAVLEEYNGSSLPALQMDMAELVGALPAQDQAFVAEAWAAYGWRPTLVSTALVDRREEALFALQDVHDLAAPLKSFVKYSADVTAVAFSMDGVLLLLAHPALLLLLPVALPALAALAAASLCASAACAVLASVRHLAAAFLSFKATLLAKQLAHDAHHALSHARWALRAGVTCVQVAARVVKRLWGRWRGVPQQRTKKD